MYKVVSEYAKNILACMENTLKEEYFAVYGEYTFPIKLSLSRRIPPKTKKNLIQNHLTDMIVWEKTISRYCPFKA
jgi:hypothetical protein